MLGRVSDALAAIRWVTRALIHIAFLNTGTFQPIPPQAPRSLLAS